MRATRRRGGRAPTAAAAGAATRCPGLAAAAALVRSAARRGAGRRLHEVRVLVRRGPGRPVATRGALVAGRAMLAKGGAPARAVALVRCVLAARRRRARGARRRVGRLVRRGARAHTRVGRRAQGRTHTRAGGLAQGRSDPRAGRRAEGAWRHEVVGAVATHVRHVVGRHGLAAAVARQRRLPLVGGRGVEGARARLHRQGLLLVRVRVEVVVLRREEERVRRHEADAKVGRGAEVAELLRVPRRRGRHAKALRLQQHREARGLLPALEGEDERARALGGRLAALERVPARGQHAARGVSGRVAGARRGCGAVASAHALVVRAGVEDQHPRSVHLLLAQDLGGLAEHCAGALAHQPLRRDGAG